MYYIDETNRKQHSYPTYGRQFASYRWYKPIITGAVFAAIYMALFLIGVMAIGIANGVAEGSADSFDALMNSLEGGYDSMDLANPLLTAVDLGGLALIIPSLWLASVIVRDRPFSSYQSSRGGWSRKVFWKCLPIAFLVNGLPIIINDVVIEKGYQDFTFRFTAVSFLILTILGPLQCIAEEYLFRGFIMQTLGSWLRISLIAVIVQAVVFAAGHPYNRIGQISILASGLGFALSAWFGRGIEVSSALHIVNNMTIFYLQGCGMTTISSEVDVEGMIMDICMTSAYVVIIFILSRKTKWFDEVRKDDLAKANAKYAEKKARKAAKKAAKAAGKGFVVAGNAAGEAINTAAEAVTSAAGGEPEQQELPTDVSYAEEPDLVFDYSREREERAAREGGKHFKH